jgi:predicted dehydrogenase
VSRFGGFGAAIIGTGFMAAVHADALRRLGVRVIGVVGSDLERASAAVREGALPPAAASLDELLREADVDVIHVTSPNHLHATHVHAAIAAGKHVVCEKPLAATLAQADELVSLAEASGRVCAVNFNNRYHGQVQELRALRTGGSLGPIHAVRGSYLQDWLLLESDWNWRVDATMGGSSRAVGDIGVHWFDLAEYVTGHRVTEVCAQLTQIHQRRGGRAVETEDAADVLLRFDGGVRGIVSVSQVSAGRLNALALEVDGADAAAVWKSERGEELWVGRRDQPAEVWPRRRQTAAPGVLPHLPAGHVEGFVDAFVRLYADVYAAVAGEAAEHPTFADGRRAVAFADAVRRSAAEGRWMPIAD